MDTSKPKDLKYRTYDFSIQLIKFIGTVEVKQVYCSMLDQVLRSGTSIGANVIEGRSGSSLRDLINFYRIALKSSNETKYWLCLLRDGLELDKIKLTSFLKRLTKSQELLQRV
jgi:four helix bundle protein